MPDSDLSSPDVVEDLWRPLADTELPAVNRWITLASVHVRAKVADIDDRIAAGTLSADVVATIVAAMVIRVLDVSANIQTRTLGPESVTYRAQAVSGLGLTVDELALLRGASSAPTPGVGSIRLRITSP